MTVILILLFLVTMTNPVRADEPTQASHNSGDGIDLEPPSVDESGRDLLLPPQPVAELRPPPPRTINAGIDRDTFALVKGLGSADQTRVKEAQARLEDLVKGLGDGSFTKRQQNQAELTVIAKEVSTANKHPMYKAFHDVLRDAGHLSENAEIRGRVADIAKIPVLPLQFKQGADGADQEAKDAIRRDIKVAVKAMDALKQDKEWVGRANGLSDKIKKAGGVTPDIHTELEALERSTSDLLGGRRVWAGRDKDGFIFQLEGGTALPFSRKSGFDGGNFSVTMSIRNPNPSPSRPEPSKIYGRATVSLSNETGVKIDAPFLDTVGLKGQPHDEGRPDVTEIQPALP